MLRGIEAKMRNLKVWIITMPGEMWGEEIVEYKMAKKNVYN